MGGDEGARCRARVVSCGKNVRCALFTLLARTPSRVARLRIWLHRCTNCTLDQAWHRMSKVCRHNFDGIVTECQCPPARSLLTLHSLLSAAFIDDYLRRFSVGDEKVRSVIFLSEMHVRERK
jgi:hypothetical protein